MTVPSSRSPDYCERVDRPTALLQSFAREPGRSVYAIVRTPELEWAGGVCEDTSRPAASLLKLPLAMALEPRLAELAPCSVASLLQADDDATILRALDPDRLLAPSEMLRLMLMASDNPCARWALQQVGVSAVAAAANVSSAGASTVGENPREPGALVGSVTARGAVAMLQAVLDTVSFPVSSAALRQSIRNARIPLGATTDDVSIAHKTGTLTGVAHDVANLRCRTGDMWIAFLAEEQHDTLVTGYEMGICTRSLLEHFGLQVERTVSAVVET